MKKSVDLGIWSLQGVLELMKSIKVLQPSPSRGRSAKEQELLTRLAGDSLADLPLRGLSLCVS